MDGKPPKREKSKVEFMAGPEGNIDQPHMGKVSTAVKKNGGPGLPFVCLAQGTLSGFKAAALTKKAAPSEGEKQDVTPVSTPVFGATSRISL